jgi:hypothetical protein
MQARRGICWPHAATVGNIAVVRVIRYLPGRERRC